MSDAELRNLGWLLIAIGSGAKWECEWTSGWGPPLGRDLEMCISQRIPIRLAEDSVGRPCNAENPLITCQAIFELYNCVPEHGIADDINMPADNLHELALAYCASREKLEAVMDRLANSENSSREMRNEIVKVLRREGA